MLSLISPRDRALLASRFFGATDKAAALVSRSHPTLACRILDWAGLAVRGKQPKPPASPLLRLVMPDNSTAVALLEVPGHATEVIELSALDADLLGHHCRSG